MQKLGSVSIQSAVPGTFYIVPLDAAPHDPAACFCTAAGSMTSDPAQQFRGSMYPVEPWAPKPATFALVGVVCPPQLPTSLSFTGMPPYKGLGNAEGKWFAHLLATSSGAFAAHVIG